jgi:hypothetical protein
VEELITNNCTHLPLGLAMGKRHHGGDEAVSIVMRWTIDLISAIIAEMSARP